MSHPKENLSGLLLLAEYDVHELFADESAAWAYAVEHASFSHKEACEFMFYVGGETQDFLDSLGMHSAQGCPQELISYLKHARDLGATWAMFYA